MDLAHHFNQEIQILDQLILLLDEERQALKQRQFEKLEHIAPKKEDLSSQLKSLSEIRMQFILDQADMNNYKPQFVEYLKTLSDEQRQIINQLNDTLVAKIMACKEANNINGQVVTANLHTRTETVAILTGQHPVVPNAYTAQGNIEQKATPNYVEKV